MALWDKFLQAHLKETPLSRFQVQAWGASLAGLLIIPHQQMSMIEVDPSLRSSSKIRFYLVFSFCLFLFVVCWLFVGCLLFVCCFFFGFFMVFNR